PSPVAAADRAGGFEADKHHTRTEGGHTAAGLSHQAEGFSPVDVEIHTGHGSHVCGLTPRAASPDRVVDPQSTYVQDGFLGVGRLSRHRWPLPGWWKRPRARRAGVPGAGIGLAVRDREGRSEEHTSELQSRLDLVCRLLREK